MDRLAAPPTAPPAPLRARRMVVALVCLAGCVAGPGDSGGPKADDLTTDGLEITLATVPTVIQLRWTTADATRSDVTATFGDETITHAETSASTDHAVTLTGFPALTEVDVVVSADDTFARAEASIETGALPAWVPELAFVADAPEAAAGGFTIAPVIISFGGGIVGIDHAGRVVWSWPQNETGLPALPYRAWLSKDGTSILWDHAAETAILPGPINRVSLDGSALTELSVIGGHTDFVEYTEGGFLSLSWEIRDIGDRRILGDTIRELAPDGTERVVWSVWDDFEPDLTRTYPLPYPAEPDVEDWSHINGISYDPVEDDVYVTASFNDGVIRVDRTTGEMVWWLSDSHGGDFTNTDGTERVLWPHSVQRIDGGITVFSRGKPDVPGTCSWAVDLALDESAGTSTETWRYTAPDCLLVPFLGSAERLGGGNTLISWTSAGRLDEVTPGGEVAWEVSSAIGAAFGFSSRVERLGP